jgi:release factor glutamine methyltransferase
MKLKEVLDRTVVFFKEKKIESARLDTEILLAHALGLKNRVEIYLKYDQPLSDDELSKCRDLVRRRSQGEPVAYITGQKEFFGISFLVNPSVLIPRPETELLVEAAIDWIQKQSLTHPRILDLGCGSGCIGQSILKKFPEASLVQVDISEAALETSKKNAEKNQTLDRIQFVCSDVGQLDLGTEKFDVILANPPYIDRDDPKLEENVRKFEPHQALFADHQGLESLKTWSQKTIPHLKSKSLMGFEMGFDQSRDMKDYFENLRAFHKISLVQDYSGVARHILGEKNG